MESDCVEIEVHRVKIEVLLFLPCNITVDTQEPSVFELLL